MKKQFIIFLIVSLVLVSSVFAYPMAGTRHHKRHSVLLGDVDHNGAVNYGDVFAYQKMVKTSSSWKCTNRAADLNGDGRITSEDKILLQRRLRSGNARGNVVMNKGC